MIKPQGVTRVLFTQTTPMQTTLHTHTHTPRDLHLQLSHTTGGEWRGKAVGEQGSNDLPSKPKHTKWYNTGFLQTM